MMSRSVSSPYRLDFRLPRSVARRLAVLALAVAGCGGSPTPAASPSKPELAEATSVLGRSGLPGSRVRMRLPDGFVRRTRHPTVFHDELKMAVTVAEITPPTEADAQEALSALAQSAASFRSPERVAIAHGSSKGYMIRGTKEDDRMSILLGLANGRILLVMSIGYPREGATVAEAIVDSVWIDANAKLDSPRLSALSFGDTQGFVVWDAIAPPVGFKEPNAQPPIPVSSPTFSVVTVPARNEDVAPVVAAMLEQKHVDRHSAKVTTTQVDGLEATEIVADAVDDGVPVKFYALVMNDPAGLVFASGQFLPTQPNVLGRMQKLARSIHRVDDLLGPVHLP